MGTINIRRTYKNASVPSGKYLTKVGSYIYISSDFGYTWTPKMTDTTRNWRGIAISSDGKYQTAVGIDGSIYRSTDYGVTWSTTCSFENYFNVTMSGDGKYQAVSGTSFIYISTDYGITWVSHVLVSDSTDITYNLGFCSMSKNGKYVIVSFNYYDSDIRSYYTKFYLSSDYGSSWTFPSQTEFPSNAKFSARADLSSDGKYITVTYPSPWKYFSSDYGNSFNSRYITYGEDVSLSSDGKYQTMVNSSSVELSSDYGASFTELINVGYSNRIATNK